MYNKKIISILMVLIAAHSVTATSLWPENKKVGSSLFSDTTANQIGDLVTIVVNLSTVASRDQSTDTSKDATVNDTITALGYPQNFGMYDWYRYRELAPSMNWSAAQAFKGGGKLSNTEKLTTTIQARVVDVFPNGTMQVEARRHFETAKEKSVLVMTGVIRREDLDTTNSVSSNKVADLEIKQEGAGPLSRSQRKGWLTTLYEFVSPF
jgi:flagellar L-ring protein precursor FlgH